MPQSKRKTTYYCFREDYGGFFAQELITPRILEKNQIPMDKVIKVRLTRDEWYWTIGCRFPFCTIVTD